MKKIRFFQIEEDKNLYRFEIKTSYGETFGSCWCYKSFEEAFKSAINYLEIIKK